MGEDKCTATEEAYARSFNRCFSRGNCMIQKFGGRFSSAITRNCVDFKYSGIEARIIFKEYGNAMVHLTLEMSTLKNGDEKKLTLGHLQTLGSQLTNRELSEAFVYCAIDELVIPGLKHFYSQYMK